MKTPKTIIEKHLQQPKNAILSEDDIDMYIIEYKKCQKLIKLNQVDYLSNFITDGRLCSIFIERCTSYNINFVRRQNIDFAVIENHEDIQKYLDAQINRPNTLEKNEIELLANCIAVRQLRDEFRSKCFKFNQEWIKKNAEIKDFYDYLRTNHLVKIHNGKITLDYIYQVVNDFQIKETERQQKETKRIEELIVEFGIRVQKNGGTYEEVEKLQKLVEEALIPSLAKKKMMSMLDRYKKYGYLHFAGGAGSIATSNSVYHIYNRNGKK